MNRKEWVEEPPPPLGTPAGDLHAIRLLNQHGDFKSALVATKKFVGRYGKSDPHYPELLVANAQTLIGHKEYGKAHNLLQEFLSQYGGMSATSDALRLEFVIAEAFLGGAKRKIAGLSLLSGVDVGYNILDEIASNYPDDPLAELAIKTKADHLFQAGDHQLAQLEYARLMQTFPQSRYHLYSLRRAADSALAEYAGVDYDEAPLVDAAERYRDYRAANPRQAEHEDVGLILDRIRESRAEKTYAVGTYYERTGHLSSAVYYYNLVLEEWPDSVAAVKAATHLHLLGAIQSMPPGGTNHTPAARPGPADEPTP